MASDVTATSGRLANYTKTEEKHNAKVNSQSVPTSDEKLRRRDSRPLAYADVNHSAAHACRSVGLACQHVARRTDWRNLTFCCLQNFNVTFYIM